MAQTRSVIAALKVKHPRIEVRIKEIVSAGDKDRRTALWDLKDTGFFTSRLEEALLAGEADVAVHSLKDLPTHQRDGLSLAAICDRQWPEDCLLARRSVGSIDELPRSARVGTSSLRRAAQLRHLRPDLALEPLRGNVQTRISKLETTELDAIILARAGLERLGLADRISVVFDPRQFIPAPGQGALAVQTRSDDREAVEVVRSIDDELSRALASAERQVLAAMQCGCHAPVGAYAQSRDGVIELHAFLSDVQGRGIIKRQTSGPVSEALPLGQRLAGELLDAGGREILRDLERKQDTDGLRT